MDTNTVLVIGGAGAVGSLFCELLLKDKQRVTVLDLHCRKEAQIPGVKYVEGDLKDNKSRALIQQAKLIILAIPEDPAIESIELFAKLLQPGQCLIDTMSVKSVIVERLLKFAPAFEVISINPMFGPSLGFKNQSVACVKINAAKISENLLSLIRSEGASVIFLTAEEHDRYTAAIQAATHAAILSFGMTLDKLDYNPNLAQAIWTPPHKIMLALLARILSADPEVYRDIQASNPYAEEARLAMRDSLNVLNTHVVDGTPADFAALFSQLKSILGQSEDDLAAVSQHIFRHL